MKPTEPTNDVKACCATLYESDMARMLLGDSFHPGGLPLTKRLGEKLGLKPGMRVLDVASGKGESAIFLAQTFGCEVLGIDYGARNTEEASARAKAANLGSMVTFESGDAEKIAHPDGTFDAVVCECAFCTFPDKYAAAGEFARVVKTGGKVGLSDLTRDSTLPPELSGLLAWVACIADAQPVDEYARYLSGAGLRETTIEPHDEALSEMVRDIQGKLLGVELMSKLKKIDLAGVDFAEAKAMARAAADAIRSRKLGYALICATK